METTQLSNFLRREHPQTAALILAHLNPRKAAGIISGLKPDLQSEIMYRLATMGKTSPEMVSDIEDVLRNQLGSVIGAEMSSTGGIEQVAELSSGPAGDCGAAPGSVSPVQGSRAGTSTIFQI